jgi:hypothetical protein
MRRGGARLVVTMLVALSAATCGGGANAPSDAGSHEAPDAIDAVIDVPLVCPDANPPASPDAATPTGPLTCGGEVAVAGVTPYGPFVATNVTAFLGFGDCSGLSISLDDRVDGVTRNDEIEISILMIPVADESSRSSACSTRRASYRASRRVGSRALMSSSRAVRRSPRASMAPPVETAAATGSSSDASTSTPAAVTSRGRSRFPSARGARARSEERRRSERLLDLHLPVRRASPPH